MSAPTFPKRPPIFPATLLRTRDTSYYEDDYHVKELRVWGSVIIGVAGTVFSFFTWLVMSDWSEDSEQMTAAAWPFFFNLLVPLAVAFAFNRYVTRYLHHPWFKLTKGQRRLLTTFRRLPAAEQSRFRHFETMVADDTLDYRAQEAFEQFVKEYDRTSPEADKVKREREAIAERNKDLIEAFKTEQKLRADIRKEMAD